MDKPAQVYIYRHPPRAGLNPRRMIFPLLVSLVLTSLPAFAGNVILITLDGVRFEDARPEFAGTGALEFPLRVSTSSAVSLPGYRAIFTGEFESRCEHNYGCGNIDRETLIDRLVDQGVPEERLGAFASWAGLDLALESKPRAFRMVNGKISGASGKLSRELLDRLHSTATTALSDLPEWGSAIRDEYTRSMAMDFIRTQSPQFFYVGLLDTDEWAHRKDQRRYHEAHEQSVAWIGELRKTLAAMGDYGRDTTIIVSTDHGRGRWPFFSGHGKGIAHSFQSWAQVYLPATKQGLATEGAIELREQTDLRPLIERILGDR